MTELRDLLPGARAVVVGDVMLDEYVWGHVSRISPEAPVPVVDVRRRTHVPGGAANAASGVAALGGRVAIGGVIGDDRAGELLRDALRGHGIDAAGLVAAAGRATTTKTRVVAHNQQVVRTDVEERNALPEAVERELAAWVDAEVHRSDVVVLSDYAKGVVSRSLARHVIDRAKERAIPVVVDPKGSDYAKYSGATVLTPNVRDAKRAAHVAPETFVELGEVVRRLAGTLPGSALLITRGAEGMSLFADSGAFDVAAEAHDVYDVTGAGDTVVAVLAVALARGLDLERAVRLANTAAGIVVSKVGTASVTVEELAARLEDQAPS